MKYIDVRSDTGTLPTKKMRTAMANAIVGDDVCQDDPTVIKLEELAAKMTGKESALFVPSGTFGNQLCIFTHCERGNEVILDDTSHIIEHEAAGSAIIAGVQLRTIESTNGLMSLEQIEKRIRKVIDIHLPKTGLICVENARATGKVVKIEDLKDIYELALKYKIPVHMDGARVFNAATALKIEAKEILKYCDSAMFCLSKGLCAPIGSMIVGSKEFIEKARFKRKIMGGGMRQVGVIAAPAIIALEEMTKRLDEDHKNAKKLAILLNEMDDIDIDFTNLDINMVFFSTKADIDEEAIVEFFKEKNILIYPPEEGVFRFVTNNGISENDVAFVAKTMEAFLYSKNP